MTAIRLNKFCEVEDFQNPTIVEAIRAMEPEYAARYPGFPKGLEHRKSWEYAQLMVGSEQLGVLRPDSIVLAVAAGHERPIFALTSRVRLVYATDIYGSGDFSGREAQASMLTNPDAFTPFPYNRRRLIVQHMNALDLRYEDNSFDLVFSLSSIEHFGGIDGARAGLLEMQRVCRPGGVVMLATEGIVNGKPDVERGNLYLFSPAALQELVASATEMELVEPFQFDISEATRKSSRNLDRVVADLLAHRGTEHPHVVLEMEGRDFTSISIFLRKKGA